MSQDEGHVVSENVFTNQVAAVHDADYISSHTRLSERAEDILYEIGFEIGDDLESVSMVDVVSVPGGGPKIVKEIFDFRHQNLNNSVQVQISQQEEKGALGLLIDGLKVRPKRVLTSLNIQTLEEFVKLHWTTILQAHSCGRETFDLIIELQNRVRKLLLNNPNPTYEQLLLLINSDPGHIIQYPDFSSLRQPQL